MLTKNDVPRLLLLHELILALLCWLLGLGAVTFHFRYLSNSRFFETTIIALAGYVLFILGTVSLVLILKALAKYRKAAIGADKTLKKSAPAPSGEPMQPVVCPSCGAACGESKDGKKKSDSVRA